jgi:hypothetical protein
MEGEIFNGNTYIPGETDSPLESLMEVADKALYNAKKSGRNRVSFIEVAQLSVKGEGGSEGQLFNAFQQL